MTNDRGTSRRRVLIVDDDRDVARGAGLRLRAAGYDVAVAHNGPDALQAVEREPPDAIVLDMRMPGMDGLTVLSRLRAKPATRDTPVVVLSASVVDKATVCSPDLAARFFLEKPHTPTQLLAAVASAVAEEWTAERNQPPANADARR